MAALDPREWLPARSVDVELGLRQMAVMLRSGLTLLDALTTVAEQAQRRTMGRIWRQVADEIQQGASLGDAMGRHPRFSLMVVELVRVGSQTGQLEPVLTKAATSLEHRRHIRTSLLTALTYPTIVLLAAIGVTGFMALNVIPKLEKFLTHDRAAAPADDAAALGHHPCHTDLLSARRGGDRPAGRGRRGLLPLVAWPADRRPARCCGFR